MQSEQSYATHRRWFPLFHFVVIPLLTLNVIARIVYLVRHPGAKLNWWEVVVAIALLLFGFAARIMVLTVQSRVIRLEERLRLQRVLPEELRGRVGELRTSQLVALRFCADEDLPDLCRAVLSGEVREMDEIKKRVKNWRPDWLRA
jgi:amino acid transporter